MINVKLSIGFMLSLGLFSCKQRNYNYNNETNGSEIKTLEAIKAIKEEVIPTAVFKLSFAEQNKIPYSVVKKYINNSNEFNNYYLKITFGKLSKDNYEKLMSRYAGANLVKYDKDKIYELEDFLAPKMQALVNQFLLPRLEKDATIPKQWRHPETADEVPTVAIGMNCWDVAYEFLRDFSPTVPKNIKEMRGKIAHFGPAEAEKFLLDDKFIQKKVDLASNLWSKDKLNERNKDRAFGDLLYISTDEALVGPAHVAIWIDNDLFFEKTNFEGSDPIRLAFFSDLIKPYIEQSNPQMKVIRYKDAAKTKYPEQDTLTGMPIFEEAEKTKLDPVLKKEVIFTMELGLNGNLTTYGIYRIKNFPVIQGVNGRALFDGASNITNFYKNTNICISEDKNSKYNYKLTNTLDLIIFDKKGKQLATYAGKRNNKNNLTFSVTEKKEIPSYLIKLTKSNDGNFVISHPNIGTSIPTTCIDAEL